MQGVHTDVCEEKGVWRRKGCVSDLCTRVSGGAAPIARLLEGLSVCGDTCVCWENVGCVFVACVCTCVRSGMDEPPPQVCALGV